MYNWILFILQVLVIMTIGWIGAAIYFNWGTHRTSTWFGVISKVFKNEKD